MSGTMMDNKPLSPSSADPDPPLPADDAKPAASSLPPVSLPSSSLSSLPSSPPTTGARRESPLRDVFVGPDGIHAVPRWLLYLAMAWIVYQVEGWLVMSLRSNVSDLWWRIMIEASMMLAAILPGFVMARVESRPFGDFGLPARRASHLQRAVTPSDGVGTHAIARWGSARAMCKICELVHARPKIVGHHPA